MPKLGEVFIDDTKPAYECAAFIDMVSLHDAIPSKHGIRMMLRRTYKELSQRIDDARQRPGWLALMHELNKGVE